LNEQSCTFMHLAYQNPKKIIILFVILFLQFRKTANQIAVFRSSMSSIKS